MDLKHEFLAALQNGTDFDALVELVHQHQKRGLSPQESYHVLHQIWLDFGYNKSHESTEMRDILEYVMDKIWYECPARGGKIA